MAAGAQATRHGWRASYQTMGIFNAILFLCFIFLYEETKYIRLLTGQSSPTEEEIHDPDTKSTKDALDTLSTKGPKVTEQARSHHILDLAIPRNSWRTRLALTTPTPEPIWPHFFRPFGVLIFPAVAFAALQYAAGVVWLTVLSNVLGLTFPKPPYLFSPEQIGYSSAGPLIGNILGAVYGGFLGDRSILYYARRNKGFYEPEMRLYILHVPAVLMAGGLVMFGVTISRVRVTYFCGSREC
jgi:MFS family permease